MSQTAIDIIEYGAIPVFLIVTNIIVQVLLERSRRKKEARADPGCFTVRMPVIFTICLVTAFIFFTVIAVFFTRQVIKESDSGIPWSQILTGDICMGALDALCLVYAYMFIRRKIEVVGNTAKVTPAFSKPYTFNPLQVTKVEKYNDKIKVRINNKRLSVYRINYCCNLFDGWLGW